MVEQYDRRSILKLAAAASGAVGLNVLLRPSLFAAENPAPKFKISLAEWSFHQMLYDGKLDNLDFPALAKREFGIDCVEYVNVFFQDKARDRKYLAELRKRCDDNGVVSGLIMCDAEGDMGDPDSNKRTQTVENHYKWVEAAKFLGCHSIRVNAGSAGSYDEQKKYAADGLRRLAEFGGKHEMNVIVENHGGLSSNGKWLASVIRDVNLPNCGTLPDFGNFQISPTEEYDRYLGVKELMPFAKGVSAKSEKFNPEGNEASIDYLIMMKIVVDSGYHGWVGIEWNGETPGELEGVRLTQKLLKRIRQRLAESDH